MPRLMFSVFAERITADQFSNALDVLNVIEQLHVPEPPPAAVAKARERKRHPAVPGRLALLVHWRRSNPAKGESRLRQRVELLSPRGTLLASGEMDFTLAASQYVRNVTNFQAVPVVGEGTYTARISVKVGKRWRRAGETSYELAYVRLPAPGAKLRVH